MFSESIWEIIERDNADEITNFHASGGSLSKTHLISGDSLLQYAFDHNSKSCFQKLLDIGAPSDIRLRNRTFVTHWAAASEDPWWLIKLIEHDADISAWSDGQGSQMGTPVHFSIMNGRDENVRLLIAAGMNLDAVVESMGRSAVASASYQAKFEIVAMLLEAGASPTAGKKEKDSLLGSLRRRSFDSKWCDGVDEVIRLLANMGYGKEVFEGCYFGNRTYETRLIESRASIVPKNSDDPAEG